MFINSCKWCNNFTVFGRGGKPLANVCQLWERATIVEGNLMKLRARHSFYCLLSDYKMKIVCSNCRLKLIPAVYSRIEALHTQQIYHMQLTAVGDYQPI